MAVLLLGLLLSGLAGGGGKAAAADAPGEIPKTDALPTLEDILGADRVWRYTDDPVRLARIRGTEWTAPGYDDSGWLSAAGAFGAYEGKLHEIDGEEPTVCLRHYLPDGDAVPTYYFRLSFTARPEDILGPLDADICYDDAVLVYLNGQVIFSGNVPAEGYPGPNAYGCGAFLGSPPHETVTLDSSMFTEGVNTLCVELHQAAEDSSDIFFSLGELCWGPAEQGLLRSETLNLGVGADETQMLVTWRGSIREDAYVQLEPWNPDWASFSDAAAVYPAQRAYEDEGTCTCRAVLTDLAPGEYVYRAVDEYPTLTQRFTVSDPEDGFFFLCHGDTQIEDDKDAMADYEALAEHIMAGQTPQLVLSLGDQIDDAGSAGEYRIFTGTPLFKSVPLAAVVGNHEKDSRGFSRVFSLPNMDSDTEDSSGDMSGDCWFFRGSTLFLCLNSNNYDIDAHREFLSRAREACIQRYGQPVWTVAAFHHAVFSAGSHAYDDSILERRGPYADMLTEAGVDIVFSGHDHSYTRSWPMDGETPLADGSDGGTVYFTLGSSTGSKYYSVVGDELEYAAFRSGDEYPAMTRVDVTDDTFTVTTYQKQEDDIVVLDTYQLIK